MKKMEKWKKSKTWKLKMENLKILEKWYGMVPYGTIWYHEVPYGAIWYHMVPYGTIWYHRLVSCWSRVFAIWHLGHSEFVPWHLRAVPYGTIWCHMVPYGTIWYPMVPYGTIRYHMVPHDPLPPRWGPSLFGSTAFVEEITSEKLQTCQKNIFKS